MNGSNPPYLAGMTRNDLTQGTKFRYIVSGLWAGDSTIYTVTAMAVDTDEYGTRRFIPERWYARPVEVVK